MKRLFFSIISVVLILFMLSSCTTGIQEPTNSSTVLTVWHYYNGATKDMFDSLVLEFNETVGEEKNIVIDAYSYSSVNDLADAVLAAGREDVGAEDMPDIFGAYSDNALTLDNMGLLANLTPYFTQEELSLYRQDFLEEGMFDSEGNLKIVPIAKSTEILYINSTDFDTFLNDTNLDIDIMDTWEGIAQASKLYYEYTDNKTKEANDGKALFGVDSISNYMIIACKQLGQDIYNETDGKITFNLTKENAQKIWDTMYIPYLNGYYASYGRFRSDDVKSGDLLAYVGSTASTYYFPTALELGKDNSYDIECVTLNYPYFEGGEKYAIQQGAGMLVSKSSEEKEKAAVEFLKWFTLPENNMEFAVSTGYMPVQNESLKYDSIYALIDENSKSLSAVTSSTQTIYNEILTDYTLHTTKPFEGSFEARTTLETFFHDYIKQELDTLSNRISNGETKEDVITSLISQEKFDTWYNQLTTQMNDTLN